MYDIFLFLTNPSCKDQFNLFQNFITPTALKTNHMAD